MHHVPFGDVFVIHVTKKFKLFVINNHWIENERYVYNLDRNGEEVEEIPPAEVSIYTKRVDLNDLSV